MVFEAIFWKINRFLTQKSCAMKQFKFLMIPVLALMALSSCTSVKVISDYDREANFGAYKTYAFYKTGTDKAQISDLDKKRILKAIENEMSSRGFVKSQNPDVLVSIFTKEREQVDVYSGGGFGGFGRFGFGFGRGFGFYNPWLWGGGFGPYGNTVSTRTEGSLYIDLIDANNNQLVWQGKGVGDLGNINNIDKKEQRIREFVSEILEAYPPAAVAAN